jgi:hypothetical protein
LLTGRQDPVRIILCYYPALGGGRPFPRVSLNGTAKRVQFSVKGLQMRAFRCSINKPQARRYRASFGRRQFEQLEPRCLLDADVIISEIMYQSFTDLGLPEDYREEYIELCNRGDSAADRTNTWW